MPTQAECSANSPIWPRVDEWIERSQNPPRELQGIAGWRASERGDRETAERYQNIRRNIAFVQLTVPTILERIRSATKQELLVLKGPETARCYPAPGTRPFGDLDLLVRDVPAAENAMLAAGFVRLGIPGEDDLPGHFHDIALRLANTPLAIELHRSPGWLSWMTPLSNEELFARAIPSVTGVERVFTLPPLEHTLFLAVHSWRHGPFHSLLHMIDIELMRQNCDPVELEATAQLWGMENVWRHTCNMIEWCFYDPHRPLSPMERLWSRHLREMRPRTLRELYFATRTKGLAADGLGDVVSGLAADVAWTVQLRPGESYRSVGRYAVRRLVRRDEPAITAKRRH